jgi:transmembrane 9 superfamily protein 2/4
MFLCRDTFRVVGFEVEAMSIDYTQLKFPNADTCSFPDQPKWQLVNEQSGTRLFFTYSVEWRKSEVSWASRWDIYLGMSDVQIHWFSIINSLVVVFFLSGENGHAM